MVPETILRRYQPWRWQCSVKNMPPDDDDDNKLPCAKRLMLVTSNICHECIPWADGYQRVWWVGSHRLQLAAAHHMMSSDLALHQKWVDSCPAPARPASLLHKHLTRHVALPHRLSSHSVTGSVTHTHQCTYDQTTSQCDRLCDTYKHTPVYIWPDHISQCERLCDIHTPVYIWPDHISQCDRLCDTHTHTHIQCTYDDHISRCDRLCDTHTNTHQCTYDQTVCLTNRPHVLTVDL